MVKSLSSGKEFIVPNNRLNVPTVSIEPVKPTKKMSLMDAAVAALKDSGEPMDTRGIVKPVAEKGYWTPTVCKTRFSGLLQNGEHSFCKLGAEVELKIRGGQVPLEIRKS